MEYMIDLKKRKVREMTKEINHLALIVGYDDGSGDFSPLHRICDGTATVLEQKRADKADIEVEFQLMKLLHDRSRLIRDIQRVEMHT